MAEPSNMWHSIEIKMKLAVPCYIKNILASCGYDNYYTIATIEEADMAYFQKEMRDGKVFKHFAGKKSEADVLEGCSYSGTDFEFSRGHQKLVLAIVKFVKETIEKDGVDGFSSPQQGSKSRAKNASKSKKDLSVEAKRPKISSNTDHSPNVESEITEQQLSDEIDKHETEIVRKAKITLDAMVPLLYNKHKEDGKDDVRSEVSIELVKGEFKTIGRVHCPLCAKKTMVFKTSAQGSSTDSWNTSNYDRHLKTRLSAEFELKQKNSDVKIPDAIDLESDTESKEQIKRTEKSKGKSSEKSHKKLIHLDEVQSAAAQLHNESTIDLKETVKITGRDDNETLNGSGDVVKVDGQGKQNELLNGFGNETYVELSEHCKQKETMSDLDKETIGESAGQGKQLEILSSDEKIDLEMAVDGKRVSKYDGQATKPKTLPSKKEHSKLTRPSLEFASMKNRNLILKQLYEGWCKSGNIQKNNETTFINCTTGVGSLFAKMCKIEERFATAVYERSCMKCGTVFKKVTPFMKTNDKVRRLGKIADYLDIKPRERDCTTCKSKCKAEMHFNNVIVLETEPPVKRNEAIHLQSISPDVLIGSTQYMLHAVIHFEAKHDHFVSYIRDRSNNWTCFDDLKKNALKVDARTMVNPFILCYATTTRQFDFEKLIEGKQSVKQSVLSAVLSLEEQQHGLHHGKYEPQDVPEHATEPALHAIQSEEKSEENPKSAGSVIQARKKKIE